MKVKVLIADKFPDLYIEQLKAMDLDVIYNAKLGENDLPAAAEDVDIIVVRSTIVNAETIKAGKKLNLIIRAGAGVNNINIPAANQKGVYVANCPGMNSVAVAELAMGLILSLDRRIPDNVIDFRGGVWNKGEYSKAEGLLGKNLAIIGVGAIGKEVAKRAVSFGMNVYGKDIFPFESDIIEKFSDMEKMLPTADIISIHLPLTPETRGLFNKQMFSYLKPGALLINTSRADVIDEDALIEAIKEKNIRCGFDVFKGEPEGKSGAVTSKLLNNPNVYVTHHIGASTEQAQNAVAGETVRIIRDYTRSGVIAHWVNRAKTKDSRYQLVVKHYNRSGVLTSILEVINKANINIEDIENVIFDGGVAACCTMKLKEAISADVLKVISANENVLNVSHAAI